MDLERLKELSSLVGRKRLVLDLSCRKKVFSFSMKLPFIKKIKLKRYPHFCAPRKTRSFILVWKTFSSKIG